MPELYEAVTNPVTKQFLKEYLSLCKKYGMYLVSVENGEPSHHDSMRVSPYDEEAGKFILQTVMVEEDFEVPTT